MDIHILVFFIVAVTSHPVSESDPTFLKIVDDCWEWRLQNNPEFASNVGDHRFDDQLEDYSLDAFGPRRVAVSGFLARLGTLVRERLPAVDRVSYDVLKDTLQTWIDGYEWRYYGPMSGISFIDGIQTQHGSRAGLVQFTTEQGFRNFVSRINKYAARVNQTIERMNKAIEMNTTLHAVSMAKVTGQLDGIIVYKSNITEFSFYSPFTHDLDMLLENGLTTEANRTKIRDDAKKAIAVFITQMEKLKTYITTTYDAHTRTDLGVLNMPRGRDYYKACLKWHLSVDLTPEEIHQSGLREVARVHEEMVKIMKKENHEGTVQEFFNKLRTNQSFYIQDKVNLSEEMDKYERRDSIKCFPDCLKTEETLQKLRSIVKDRIEPKLNRYFKDIPQGFPLQIKEMTYDGPAGIYKNGAPDGSRPGVYYANVMSPSNNPTFGMPSLLMHESDPGHHLQDAFALSASGIPVFRKVTDFSKYFAVPLHFPFYTAYSEGWALYAEDLGEELLIYENDYELLGKYSWEVFRAARLVVDTGIHAKGWNKERAVDYMLNITAYSRKFLEKEVDRYSTWPGQATSYTIGKLKVRELRNKAVRELCAYWDIKAFHNVILSNGAMPLSVMETVVDEWIQTVKDAANTDDMCKVSGSITINKLTSGLLILMIFVQLLF